MLRLLGILMLVSGMASAHDLVPTYPEVKESHINNIFVVKLETWNRREEIEYFEIVLGQTVKLSPQPQLSLTFGLLN